MEKVTLNTDKLLAIVQKNREGHLKDFKEALEGYRKEVADKLTRMTKLANDNQDVEFNELYALQKPQSHIKEYDRVISMLSNTTNTNVELSNRDFGRYFEDDWEWKQQWLESNSKYSASIGTVR